MATIRNILRTVRAAKWEVLRAVLYFVGLVVVMMVLGYIATGSPGAGLAALLSVLVLGYALYTALHLVGWASGQYSLGQKRFNDRRRNTKNEN